MSYQVRVALVTSHFLAASYLRELLAKLNIDPDPIVLSARDPKSSGVDLGPGVVVLVDLYDLPYPVGAYLDAFHGAAFLGLDQPRTILDTACLLLTGFAGFVSYSEIPASLDLAIRAVARGETWTSPEVMRAYIALTSRRTSTIENGVEMLTPRESQILELLRKRYSNREMAAFFGISESTIKFHVSNVFAKLNVNRRRELSQHLPVIRLTAKIA